MLRRHLKDLLEDDARSQAMAKEADGVYLDFARQNATPETLKVRVRCGPRGPTGGCRSAAACI